MNLKKESKKKPDKIEWQKDYLKYLLRTSHKPW